MWQFLYFLPLPHGHGSLRPTFVVLRIGSGFFVASPAFVDHAVLHRRPGARNRVGRRLIRKADDLLELFLFLHAEDRLGDLVLRRRPTSRRTPSCPRACTPSSDRPGRNRPGRCPSADGPSCTGGSSRRRRAGSAAGCAPGRASPAGSARRRRSTASAALRLASARQRLGRNLDAVRVSRTSSAISAASSASDLLGALERLLQLGVDLFFARRRIDARG